VNAVIAPRFAALHTQGQMAELQRLVTLSARAIFVFSLAFTAGFVVLGIPFLRIFFGPAYERAYMPMLVLLAGQLVNAGAGSVVTLLNMTGYERETAKGIVLSAGLNLALNLLLIPLWGIVGSALATTASMIVWNVVLWRAVQKKLGINTLAFARLK
jgi:O-antigen/teichoic acid export membrane protein